MCRGGDHQDPFAAAAADQLGEDHPHLEGLAQADRIGDQQTGPQTVERLDRGPMLVLQVVEEMAARHGQTTFGGRHRSLADHRLEVEARVPVVGGLVDDQIGVLGPQRLDAIQAGEEGGLGVSHQRGGAGAVHHQPVRRGVLHGAHQPLLVAHHDLGADGDLVHEGVRRGVLGRRAHRPAPPLSPGAPRLTAVLPRPSLPSRVTGWDGIDRSRHRSAEPRARNRTGTRGPVEHLSAAEPRTGDGGRRTSGSASR